MTLQVIPPELLEVKDKIETKEAQPYWKPSSLKDGESEEFRLLGCYETGHAIMGWQYASEIQDPKSGDLRFNGYVVTRSHPGSPSDIARETDWSKAERPKIDGTFVKPRRFLAWVATSAARGRLEVLFIEQKSIREQLTEILQEVEDYTWTEEGLANFSIKISKKGAVVSKLGIRLCLRFALYLTRLKSSGRLRAKASGCLTISMVKIHSMVSK